MTKRILDCSTSDLAAFTRQELLSSIAGSEGRVLAGEGIGITQPVLGDVTNAEAACEMGVQMLVLTGNPGNPSCRPAIRGWLSRKIAWRTPSLSVVCGIPITEWHYR